MSDKSYNRMTHDDILREHGARYARMTPEEKARLASEREAEERKRILARSGRRNQKLSELTLGDLSDAIEEAMQNAVVPELQALVSALNEISEKIGRGGDS
jgi:hypothetical protein